MSNEDTCLDLDEGFQDAEALDGGSLIECPCCGMADAIAEEYDICPRCAWEHNAGDEDSPWKGSAFSGPNGCDLGTHRKRVWAWLLDRDREPPKMSLLRWLHKGAEHDIEIFESALRDRILQQGPRPAFKPFGITEAEILELDKQFGVADGVDVHEHLYWGVGAKSTERGSDIIFDAVEAQMKRNRKTWHHLPFEALMTQMASEWAAAPCASLDVKWQRIIVCAALSSDGVLGVEAAKAGLVSLKKDLEDWFEKDEELVDDSQWNRIQCLRREVEWAEASSKGDDNGGVWQSAMTAYTI